MKSVISPLCFGCEALGGTDWGNSDLGSIEKAISRAVEIGVNFFDTAQVYGLGLSETRLAKALGNNRHDLIIATKGGLEWQTRSRNSRATVTRNSRPDFIVKGVEQSLRRLSIDTIPIYYVHWPDESTPFQHTFDALDRLKDEGKIRSIGCSNFTLAQINQVLQHTTIDYLQVPFSLFQRDILGHFSSFCEANSISVIAYNVLYSGLLSGKYDETSKFLANDRRSRLPSFQGDTFGALLKKADSFRVAAQKHNMDLIGYSIAWVLQHEFVGSVITGIKDVKQLEANWAAVQRQRSDDRN